MDFFGDFCLVCDGHTDGADYCSPACRLAGLDHYGTSEPASPIYCDTKGIARRPTGSIGSGLYLPPAIDFATYHHAPSSTSVNIVSSHYSTQSVQLSEQALSDLKDYAGAFDQTRTLRRRVSLQSYDGDKSPSSDR